MIKDNIKQKIIDTYSLALFNVSKEQFYMHSIIDDFQNLELYFNQDSRLIAFLENPILDLCLM